MSHNAQRAIAWLDFPDLRNSDLEAGRMSDSLTATSPSAPSVNCHELFEKGMRTY